jgi:hypothetical protein
VNLLPDKNRLEKLLGMLGSSFDGERANAARMIQALAEKNKMTINEMVAKVMIGTAPPSPKTSKGPTWTDVSPTPKRHTTSGAVLGNDLLFGLETALESNALTDWERSFAEDVSARYERDYELSEKQIKVIEKIILKAARSQSW